MTQETWNISAAGEFPWKLFFNPDAIVDGDIRPIHVQLYPTHRCNAKCSWCCYRNEARTAELDFETIRGIIRAFRLWGMRALTLTGGGEPTVHRDIEKIIALAIENGIATALVTNGIEWSRKAPRVSDQLTWVRYSVVDTYNLAGVERLRQFVDNCKAKTIGVSFTVADQPNLAVAEAYARAVATCDRLDYIRYTQDVGSTSLSAIVSVRERCAPISPKVFVQPRAEHVNGVAACRVGLLRPVVAADGYVYPCCGITHARGMQMRLPEDMRLCHWTKFDRAGIFNGLPCTRCYYNAYNMALGQLVNPVTHRRFI